MDNRGKEKGPIGAEKEGQGDFTSGGLVRKHRKKRIRKPE